MAERPRRSVPRVDYRRLHYIGLEDDSSEDEASDGENFLEDESEEEDHVEYESEEEEEEVNWEEMLVGSDGTRWDRRQRGEFPQWRNAVMDFQDGPQGEANRPGNQGLTRKSLFCLFLTPDVLEDIRRWTNVKLHELVDDWNLEHPHRPKRWKEVTIIELKAFIGLKLLAGVERPKRKPWHELWSKDESIRIAPFPATMSRDRFFDIMAALRFDDTHLRHERRREEDSRNQDRLLPIRDVFNRVVSRFQELYVPASKLCVDEQMVAFRGRCPFRVYMPNKPKKYGIKIWAATDNSSEYVLKLQVYEGRTGDQREVGLAQRVVLQLVEAYEGSGRGIIADNFFSSVPLVKELLRRKFTYCGTIRKTRQGVPPLATTAAFPGERDLFLFNEEMKATLVRHVHRRNRFVLLISSAHYSPQTVTVHDGREETTLPTIIDYYNCNKGGVDTADYMISSYTCQFPSRRWPVKLFEHLLDTVALNSWVIWNQNDPSSTRGKKSRRKFIRELARELIIPQIRARAASIPNLQSYIRSAMLIMGVDFRDFEGGRRRRTRRTASQGYCHWDNPIVSKCSHVRNQCDICYEFICQEHTTRICPHCLLYATAESNATDESEAEEME